MLRSLLKRDKNTRSNNHLPVKASQASVTSVYNNQSASSSRSARSGSTSTLLPDLISLILPFADSSTLAALALVDRYTNSIVTPQLYHAIVLHTPQSYVSFFARAQYRIACKPKHFDLLLDVVFVDDPDFARLCLQSKPGVDIPVNRSWASDVETVHLTTRGGPCFMTVTHSRGGLYKREEGYWLMDLVRLWIGRLAPAKGPKHFRWQHVDYDNPTPNCDILPGYTSVSAEGFPDEKAKFISRRHRREETPFPPFRWMFEFLSDWTATISLDLPMTSEPISEGFKLSNLELQVLEYMSLAGRTITRPLLAGVLWEVTKGKRSKKKKRLVIAIRDPIAAEMEEGLRKLMVEEDGALLKVVIEAYSMRSAAQWRADIGQRYWDNP